MSESPLGASARRVQDALAARGITADVVELPASTRTSAEAAAAIGCEVGDIAKSLVFRRTDTDEPVLAILSGARRVDEDRLAAAVGAPIAKANAAYVRERVGFVIGGVPPLGHSSPIETFIDAGLLDLVTLWAAAGTPHAVVRLTPQELVAVVAAPRVVDIGV
jgi:prolyl-tRNA editing enzyme YbaK/EbsC (Cys-tRNA(Pro) deacylase)